MGIDRAIDITAEQRETVLALLQRHLPNTTAWVYGSRAQWTSRPQSDLDMVVFATPEENSQVSDLRESFEESNLPFRVDLFIWDEVPEQFRNQIEAEHAVLAEREEQSRLTLNLATADEAAPLREILAYTRDGEWGAGDINANLIPMRVIRGTDFEAVSRGSLANVPTRYIRPDVSARKTLKPWDILIETAGGSKNRPTGRTLLVHPRILERSEIPVTCASFARFLRIHCDRANPAYIYWFLQHLYSIGEMEKHQVQHTGVARFQFTDFAANIEVPLPPLPEQRAIAHILGTLDDKIELNRRMNETLEEMARALFKSWFVDFLPVRAKQRARTPACVRRTGRQTGDPVRAKAALITPPPGGSDWTVERARAYLPAARGLAQAGLAGMDASIADLFPDRLVDSELGPIPEGWEVGVLDDAIELLSGGTPRTSVASYWGGDIPWYTAKDAPSLSDVFVLDTERTITQAGVENSATNILPFGTTIITARGTVGRLACLGVPMAMNQTCYGIRGARGYPNFFTYWNVRRTVDELQSRTHGTIFDTITRQTFKLVETALPPAELAEAFELTVTPVMGRILCNLLESRTLATLRDALLPKLVSGEVRIR